MRPLSTAVALVAVVAPLVALTAGPGEARGDELELSVDGAHWAHTLDQPLFPAAVRWVPGDERVSRFYVRNAAVDAGHLTIDVLRVKRDALLDTGYLQVAARTAGGAWTTVEDGGRHRLLEVDDLDGGSEIPVQVRVSMDNAAPNDTMVLASDLDFRVTLEDADVSDGNSDGDGTGNGTDTSGALPDTGSDVPPWLPPLGLLLLGTGAFLAGRRRHDDRDLPPTVQELSP